MGRETARDERRTETRPTPPEITEDAVSELFERAFVADEPGPEAESTSPADPENGPDVIRAIFERAFGTAELGPVPEPATTPEPPEPPEITEDAVRRMFEDAGWFGTGDTPVDADPEPARTTPVVDTTPTPREVQCPSCYGSGTQVCSSCYGSGYQTTSYTTTDWEGNVEYVTDQYPCGCSGGSVACGTCGGRGVVYR